MTKFIAFWKWLMFCILLFSYAKWLYAQDMTGISDVDNMLTTGQNIIKVAAKWGGIMTVVGAALPRMS